MKFNPTKNSEHFNVLSTELSSNVYELKPDDALVESLKRLPKNIDFSFVDEQLNTILYLAAIHGRAKTVKYLLEERSMDPNQVVAENLTAFHGAAINAHLDVMEILANHGANISAVNIYGETALIKAIDHLNGKSLDAVVDFIIIKSRETIFIPNEDGFLPIELALMKKTPSLIKKLLDAGSDVPEKLSNIAASMLLEQSKQQSSNVHTFFRKTPDQENIYQSTKLIIQAYQDKHLTEDFARMVAESRTKIKLGCEPPPGSTVDEQGRTCVP